MQTVVNLFNVQATASSTRITCLRIYSTDRPKLMSTPSGIQRVAESRCVQLTLAAGTSRGGANHSSAVGVNFIDQFSVLSRAPINLWIVRNASHRTNE